MADERAFRYGEMGGMLRRLTYSPDDIAITRQVAEAAKLRSCSTRRCWATMIGARSPLRLGSTGRLP